MHVHAGLAVGLGPRRRCQRRGRGDRERPQLRHERLRGRQPQPVLLSEPLETPGPPAHTPRDPSHVARREPTCVEERATQTERAAVHRRQRIRLCIALLLGRPLPVRAIPVLRPPSLPLPRFSKPTSLALILLFLPASLLASSTSPHPRRASSPRARRTLRRSSGLSLASTVQTSVSADSSAGAALSVAGAAHTTLSLSANADGALGALPPVPAISRCDRGLRRRAGRQEDVL